MKLAPALLTLFADLMLISWETVRQINSLIVLQNKLLGFQRGTGATVQGEHRMILSCPIWLGLYLGELPDLTFSD